MKTIQQILDERKVSVSFEIFPPKKESAIEPVLQTAADLAGLRPDFISVTYGAGGSNAANTREIASRVQTATGVPVLAHFTCIGCDRAKVAETLGAYAAAGIDNVLALRGDWPPGIPHDRAVSEFPHASDLVSAVLAYPGHSFCVGGACYPEGHPESANRERDLDNLKRKVEAGCRFLTTQMFFDNDMLYNFLYRMQARGIRVPVLAGIMPVTTATQISRMLALSNAYMPRKLLMLIDRFKDSPAALRQAGILYAIDQIVDLLSNGVRGIHIYTMNKSDIARQIMAAVGPIVAAVNGGV